MKTIDYYRSIAEASSRMVDAARANDWDALVKAEEECAHRIAALQEHQGIASLPANGGGLASPVDAKQRINLLSEILAHDAEVRELTAPWLRQLELLLSGASHDQKRLDAYRADLN